MEESHEDVSYSERILGEGGILHKVGQAFSSGLWHVDAEGRTVFWNAALAMLLGRTDEEMRGSSLREFLFPSDADIILNAVHNGGVVRGRQCRLRLLRGEGQGRWFRLEVVPTQTMEGGGPGAILVVEDTTSQHHAEEARAFLRTLVDTSDDAIFLTDIGNGITSWNRGAERMFGYSATEMRGRDCGSLVPADMIGQEADLHARMAAGETIYDMEIVGQRKDGSRVTVSLTVTPVFGRDDLVVGYSIVARDLSARRREDELRARLASIVESSDDAIVSKDLKGTIQTWNRGAERIFGYTAEEVVGKSITILLPEDRVQEEADILRVLRSGGHIDHFLTVRRTKDGRLIDVFVTSSPVRNAKGEIIGASKIARDVTELMAARREMERAQAELERRVEERTAELRSAMKEMESFAYSVSHDLRAPLRTIGLACAMLKEELETQEAGLGRTYLERVENAVKRANRLLDDLSAYARLSSVPMEPRPMDPAQIAARVWDELTRENAPAGLCFEAQTGTCAKGDPTLVRFVYQNLVGNAIKFSPDGGTIRVGQEADGTLFVSDEGVGFDMAYAGRLFEPFQRLVRDSEFPGTGMGLAGVRRIVERHGGRVWAESAPGQGATFRFTLPGASSERNASRVAA